MDIRELTTAERGAVVRLWDDAGLTRPWNDPQADFDRAHACPQSTVFGVFDGDALAGSVMVGDDGHRGWVYYLAVDAGYRQRGVGAALMAAAENWLRARGVAKVDLMVRHSNQAAGSFYAKLGYHHDEVAVFSRWLRDPPQ